MTRPPLFNTQAQAGRLKISTPLQLDHKYLNEVRLKPRWTQNTHRPPALDRVPWFVAAAVVGPAASTLKWTSKSKLRT